jgi:hypothetical protein
MQFETLAEIDAAIRDACARIGRQRDFIEEITAKGYDVRPPLSLLACLLANLRRLEQQRRELAAEMDDIVQVDAG